MQNIQHKKKMHNKTYSVQNKTSDTYNADIKDCVTGDRWILMKRK